MRVAFSDPQGPKLWRVLPYLAPIAMLVAAFELPSEAASYALGLGAASVVLWHVLGLYGSRQWSFRPAELVMGAGYVDVKNARTRTQRIQAKAITGATTARTRHGVFLTLQHRRRDQPMTLKLETEQQAEEIRRALGIGHGGFGTVAWRTANDPNSRSAFIGRLLAIGSTLVIAAAKYSGSTELALVCGMFLGFLGIIGAFMALAGLVSAPPAPSVTMSGEGIRLQTERGAFALPYDAVLDTDVTPRGITFTVPAPYNLVGVNVVSPLQGGISTTDVDVLLGQITSAAQRARGLGPEKQDPSGRVDVLRRNGEPVRDWLTRLDMTGRVLGAGAGYRGHNLDAEDLWAILEDPEAEPELRTAAARVLRHAQDPKARVRIDATVAAIRDEDMTSRMRIALSDDLDAASNELNLIEAQNRLETMTKAAQRRA